MTRTLTAPRTAKTAHTASVAEVEQMLRDAAYVLRLTRRVKADILRDAAGPGRPAAAPLDAAPALGV